MYFQLKVPRWGSVWALEFPVQFIPVSYGFNYSLSDPATVLVAMFIELNKFVRQMFFFQFLYSIV